MPTQQQKRLLFEQRNRIAYLLRDEFTTAASAPLTSPRACEPTGTLTLTQSSGQFSVSSAKLNVPVGTQALGTAENAIGAALARVAGRAILYEVTMSGDSAVISPVVGWLNSATVSTANAELAFAQSQTSGAFVSQAAAFLGSLVSITTSTSYLVAVILRSTGGYVFIKVSGTWKLIWVDGQTANATLYPAILCRTGAAATLDYFRVRDLPAPFTSSLATLSVTSFTQSVGSELLTNGGFANWTGNNPDNWTVGGEVGADPAVSETATGGGAGNGAATFVSSATINAPRIDQNVIATGTIYEVGLNVTAYTSGTVEVINSSNNKLFTSTGVRRWLWRGWVSTSQFRINQAASAATFTIDDVTIKALTLNAAQTMPADAIIDFTFALPVSPVAGEEVHLLYRTNAAGEEFLNGWDFYLRRNDANSNWDARLDSISAGTRTNRINVTSVGTNDTLRVICEGNLHDCYRKNGSTWTKVGSQVNNSSFASATGLNTVYSSTVTPASLTVYKRTDTIWSAELDRQ